MTVSQLCAWLLADHGIQVSEVTVRKLLRSQLEQRAEVAKVVLREQLGKSLLTDVDRLEKHARQLDQMADDIFVKASAEAAFLKGTERDEPIWVDGREVYAKLAEQLRKITETKLKYSGAEEVAPRAERLTEEEAAQIVREEFGDGGAFEPPMTGHAEGARADDPTRK